MKWKIRILCTPMVMTMNEKLIFENRRLKLKFESIVLTTYL